MTQRAVLRAAACHCRLNFDTLFRPVSHPPAQSFRIQPRAKQTTYLHVPMYIDRCKEWIRTFVAAAGRNSSPYQPDYRRKLHNCSVLMLTGLTSVTLEFPIDTGAGNGNGQQGR